METKEAIHKNRGRGYGGRGRRQGGYNRGRRTQNYTFGCGQTGSRYSQNVPSQHNAQAPSNHTQGYGQQLNARPPTIPFSNIWKIPKLELLLNMWTWYT